MGILGGQEVGGGQGLGVQGPGGQVEGVAVGDLGEFCQLGGQGLVGRLSQSGVGVVGVEIELLGRYWRY